MRKTISVLLLCTLSTISVAVPRSQEPTQNQQPPSSSQLTNKDVIEMIKSGLAPDVVLAKVKSTPSKFDTSAAALGQLKEAGVPDVVIMAMVQSESGSPSGLAEPKSDVVVKVPDGTEIEIQLKSTASGEELKVGDIVDFTIMRQSL